MINKDIERLNKLKQKSHKNNDELKYYNELSNLINQIKGKRDNKKNEYINMNNENREKLLELENRKKDLKLFQSQINTALNYNKISFNDVEEKVNEKSNILSQKDNNNSNNNFSNLFESRSTKNNKFKINLSTRMQNLLNKLEKEKISNDIEENDRSNDYNKCIFTQNVINSINNFIKEGNNQIIPNNNIINNINNINSNNQSNNFILLQNYYNNDNKKYKKTKNNYNNNNYITHDNISYITDRNFMSDRESNDNFYLNMNKSNIKLLDENLFKLIKNKNSRLSKSRPSINLYLDKPNINIFENQNNKYGITSNNSRGFGKSIDYGQFNESQIYLEKVNNDLQNKINDINQYKIKNKRNTYYSDYYKPNVNINNLSNHKNYDVNIMPANNIKSIFQYSKFK